MRKYASGFLFLCPWLPLLRFYALAPGIPDSCLKFPRFYYLCVVKRHNIILLTLLLMVFRSIFGSEIPECIATVPLSLTQSPLSACRYKKPFPFHCVQVVKKRISNPPHSCGYEIFRGHLQSQPLQTGIQLDLFISQFPPLGLTNSSLFAFFNWHWHACDTKPGIFHPPPFLV
jgi:hypothetical protein